MKTLKQRRKQAWIDLHAKGKLTINDWAMLSETLDAILDDALGVDDEDDDEAEEL